MISEFSGKWVEFSNFSHDPVGGYPTGSDGNVWMYMFHRAGVIIADYEAAQAAEG